MELAQSEKEDKTVCPVARTVPIISGKWTNFLIRDLVTGIKCFNLGEYSLQGSSPKGLSERLHTLEEEGIILHQTFDFCTSPRRILSD